MKIPKMIRSGLMICWMISMFWITVITVKAEQIEKTVENQAVETMSREEDAIQIEDVTGLDQEFEALEEESVFIVEEVEQYRAEAKRKRIQRAVVIVLVAAILGVGMTSGIREKKKNDPSEINEEESNVEKVTEGKV